MRDEDHPVGGHPEHRRLLERLVDERLGAHRGGRDAQAFQANDVVHTARHARPSIGQAFDSEIAVDRDLLDHLPGGGS